MKQLRLPATAVIHDEKHCHWECKMRTSNECNAENTPRRLQLDNGTERYFRTDYCVREAVEVQS